MRPRRHDAFAKICQLAGRAIGRYRMIADGDRILVGISGGKDSLMLMHVLTRLQRRAPIGFELFPACVDMGFDAFGREPLQAYFAARGWPLEMISFPGRQLLAEKMPGERPCSLCSRLRRGQLHAAADRLNCKVMALGQHLDDLCASFLVSLFRGNGLKTMGPHVAADSGRKRLIRPFCEVPVHLIREGAAELALPAIGGCDYLPEITANGDRAKAERLLDELEAHFPGVRHAMQQSMSVIREQHLLDPRFLALPPVASGTEADETCP